jgi:hypothetical protein
MWKKIRRFGGISAWSGNYGTCMQHDGKKLHTFWKFSGARRTDAPDFAPPILWISHLSNWVLGNWVLACFCSSSRSVFGMAPITEFDPALLRI